MSFRFLIVAVTGICVPSKKLNVNIGVSCVFSGILGLNNIKWKSPGDSLIVDFDGISKVKGGKTYGDIFSRSEMEYSNYNFTKADTELLFRHFDDCEKECMSLLNHQPILVLPAYDQCIKASHIFNLLDARGVVSVSERQGYILKVRNMSRKCCLEWIGKNET